MSEEMETLLKDFERFSEWERQLAIRTTIVENKAKVLSEMRADLETRIRALEAAKTSSIPERAEMTD